MTPHPTRRLLCYLLPVLLLVPLGVAWPNANAAHRSPPTPQQALEVLPTIEEVEPNDTLTQPGQQQLGAGATTSAWQQEATGRISTSGDLDWYTFTVTQPASALLIDLTNLPADYDLVLAQGQVGATDDDGLTDVVDFGGRIGAIGGRIGAIGGRIGAIGGRIGAIGGRIGAIGGRIGAISVERDTSDERIDTVLWQPGTYYVAVTGYNGAASDQPYTLRVQVNGSGLGATTPAPAVRLTLPGDPGGQGQRPEVDTLFVMSTSRLRALYPGTSSQNAVANIKANLGPLATRVNGVVLDLDAINQRPDMQLINSSETISDVYSLWDADQGNPFAANRVAQIIDNLLTAATVRNPSEGAGALPPYPNVHNIVLIGGDGIIPFYRAPDLTSFANESEYAAYMRNLDVSGIIDGGSALGGALRSRMLLTDDLYGADGTYTFPVHPLYLPDRAVGRLVETPQEIDNYLRAYQPGPLTIDARSGGAGLVTGYGFLSDQAQQVKTTFGALGLGRVTSLISDTWARGDLQQTWFDGQIDNLINPYFISQNPFQLQSINGHFDHWQTIPAADSEGAFFAERILTPTNFSSITPYFADRLAYSVGCHSGLNVEAGALAAGEPAQFGADFPEAFIKQGGNWVGNTGYGYGTDEIGYSERLSVLFSEELGRSDGPDGRTIGAALVAAKQRYVRNASRLDGFDAKVLMQWTLYGLPFLRVQVPQPLPPLAELAAPTQIPPGATPPADGLGAVERVITFTMQFDQASDPRTGSSYPVLRDVAVADSFPAKQARIGQLDQAGLPTLPTLAYPLTSLSGLNGSAPLKLQGVEFLGGSYTTADGYDPQVSQVVTQDLKLLPAGAEPPFDAGVGAWFPDAFFAVSTTEEAGRQYDQLAVTPAQFRAGAGGTQGSMRTYQTLVFRVSYIDPGAVQAPVALADTVAPTIERVTAAPTGSGSTSVVVVADDVGGASTGVAAVRVSYSDDGGVWRSLGLQQSGGDGWAGVVPVAAGSVRLLVSARDGAGNVATFTNKGEYGAAVVPAQVFLPVVVR